MELVGKVKLISNLQTFESGFKKRELVITTDDQYPQHILIEFLGERADLLDSCNIGDTIKVSINIRGREWVNPQGETKYFNSITGWRIEKNADISTHNTNNTSIPESLTKASAVEIDDDEEDDLPF